MTMVHIKQSVPYAFRPTCKLIMLHINLDIKILIVVDIKLKMKKDCVLQIVLTPHLAAITLQKCASTVNELFYRKVILNIDRIDIYNH